MLALPVVAGAKAEAVEAKARTAATDFMVDLIDYLQAVGGGRRRVTYKSVAIFTFNMVGSLLLMGFLLAPSLIDPLLAFRT